MIDEYQCITCPRGQYAQNNIVVLVHQVVWQLNILRINPQILRCTIEFCWQTVATPLRLGGLGRGNSHPKPGELPAKEAFDGTAD
jgi:hypothetical protein